MLCLFKCVRHSQYICVYLVYMIDGLDFVQLLKCRWVDHQNLFHDTLELPKSAKPPVSHLLSREKPQQALKQHSEVINV